MTPPIPQQRSYEQVPTIDLMNRLEELANDYWNLYEQMAAVQVTQAAIKNVIVARRQAGEAA